MSHAGQVSAWSAVVSSKLPHLSKPQARVLAAWSFAMVVGQSCGLTSCSVFLAALWGQNENTGRERLRDW